MIKRPTIAIIYDRKHKGSADKAAAVEVRISYQAKTTYFTTGIAVKPMEWRGGRVVKRLDMEALNNKIEQLYQAIIAKADELMQSRCFSLDNLRAAIENDYMPRAPLWQWIEQRIDERPISDATKRQHHSAMRVIQELDIFRSWSDVRLSNLKRLDERLRSMGLSQVTIYSYHKRLKPYLKDAVAFGIITRSPYDSFKTPKGSSKRIRYLTADECQQLEAEVMPTNTLQHAKDVWLFQRYTGLAYADLKALTPDNFIEQDGSVYIISERVKNDAKITIKLIDKAAAILQRYNGALPIINLSSYNQQLKQVALHAGLRKQLTSHMARHTFATQALHAGLRIEVVSKMLAHADIQTTQIYAKVLAEDIEAGFDALNK